MNGEPEVAMRFAACPDRAPATLEEARRVTHDALIAELGGRRRSGVTWHEVDALKAGPLLTELEQHARTEGDPHDYDELRDYLRRHPFGALVVATAEVDG